MTARIAISHHAAQRIAERLAPTLGPDAEAIVIDAVLDAAWNARYTRTAPDWIEARDLRRAEAVRYVVGRCVGARFVVVVAIDDRALPKVITVLTDAMASRPLPPVPTLADGRTIGARRTAPLPVAFQQAVAA